MCPGAILSSPYVKSNQAGDWPVEAIRGALGHGEGVMRVTLGREGKSARRQHQQLKGVLKHARQTAGPAKRQSMCSMPQLCVHALLATDLRPSYRPINVYFQVFIYCKICYTCPKPRWSFELLQYSMQGNLSASSWGTCSMFSDT